MSVKSHAIDYLYNKAEADYQAALMSFELLFNHSSGVGEHSTKDYLDNLEEALNKLVDAKDRLDMLEIVENYYGDNE
jgi:hypothetical protein